MNSAQTVCDMCRGNIECRYCPYWKEDYYYPDLPKELNNEEITISNGSSREAINESSKGSSKGSSMGSSMVSSRESSKVSSKGSSMESSMGSNMESSKGRLKNK